MLTNVHLPPCTQSRNESSQLASWHLLHLWCGCVVPPQAGVNCTLQPSKAPCLPQLPIASIMSCTQRLGACAGGWGESTRRSRCLHAWFPTLLPVAIVYSLSQLPLVAAKHGGRWQTVSQAKAALSTSGSRTRCLAWVSLLPLLALVLPSLISSTASNRPQVLLDGAELRKADSRGHENHRQAVISDCCLQKTSKQH